MATPNEIRNAAEQAEYHAARLNQILQDHGRGSLDDGQMHELAKRQYQALMCELATAALALEPGYGELVVLQVAA